ncbi:uncharacterized protein LOC142331059 isoform X2 [Lycorma delicatula]|uniref:uncharacterized protein LOC142331059 isoform X2 n=1 Tax=Lycorma delicatula TaxID=130591 RepID=UPI003F518366
MLLFSVLLTTVNLILLPLICNALSIPDVGKINIITNNENYEIRKYDLTNGGTGYALQRFPNDLATDVNKNIIQAFSPPEFRFQQEQYQINTCTDFTGILAKLNVVTSVTEPIVYGLCSDDIYINKVFRVGPDTGLLYADNTINVGEYNFNVTADITDQHLHAAAKVVVKVNKGNFEVHNNEDNDVKLESAGINFKVVALRINEEEKIIKDKKDSIEAKINHLEEGDGDVNTNEIYLPSFRQLWYKVLKKGFNSGLQFKDIKDLLERSQPPSERERNRVFSNFFPTNTRLRRAIPPSEPSTAPSAVDAAAFTNSVESSKIIYHESVFADTIMSGFVIFVVSFATIFFFGSIFYFAYKRLKKCGDYAVDEDAKSTSKPATDDETVYSTIQSDLKNPNILSIPEISQNRVVDSIEITKQKLNGPASVFTIQKSYEEAENEKDGNNLMVIDIEQLTVRSGNEYYKILHFSNSASTPTITATLVNEEKVPQSILSTSRRNSISSSRKDGSSLGSTGDLNENSENRRKSVTFSEIIELYHG